jgi:hypothetical protein
MLGLNTQFDLFYPLHANTSMEADQELRQSFNNIRKLVSQFVQSEVKIEELTNQHMNDLFSYRMQTIQCMHDHPVKIEIKEVVAKLAFIQDNPRFEILHENVLFGVRTNFRAVKRFLGTSDLEVDFSTLSSIPQITYSDLISLFNIFAPGSIFDKLLNLLDYSIHLELGLITSVVVCKEGLNISDAKLHELESYVARSARKFGACARIIAPVKSTMPEVVEPNPDEITPEWAAEEFLLSESALMDGLEDYPY